MPIILINSPTASIQKGIQRATWNDFISKQDFIYFWTKTYNQHFKIDRIEFHH